MTFKKRYRGIPPPCSDYGPGDGQDPRYDVRNEAGRVGNRKARQLCEQAAQTLNGLLGESGDEVLRDLVVVSVVPGPSTARLLVSVTVTGPGQTAAEVLKHLAGASGWLRSELAAAIHRRRAPDLAFRVAT